MSSKFMLLPFELDIIIKRLTNSIVSSRWLSIQSLLGHKWLPTCEPSPLIQNEKKKTRVINF